MTTGLLAAVVALALAIAIGLWWRARDGRVRAGYASMPPDASRTGAGRTGLSAAELCDQRSADAGAADLGAAGVGATLVGTAGVGRAELGARLGDRATLVQFSSAFCAPCRATRRVLAEVASMVDGVTHIEIDAESRLDLVRRLDVRRTPTTFVLGPDGHVTHRASGQPRKADVIAALGAVIEFPI